MTFELIARDGKTITCIDLPAPPPIGTLIFLPSGRYAKVIEHRIDRREPLGTWILVCETRPNP